MTKRVIKTHVPGRKRPTHAACGTRTTNFAKLASDATCVACHRIMLGLRSNLRDDDPVPMDDSVGTFTITEENPA